MKILSIAVPVYNTEKYLERCIDSMIVNGILEDIEIILVNDGSRDNSISIMNKYKKKYPKTIIVIDKENGGHGSTINAALKVATGKYFRVLDSDDWFDSSNFLKFVKKLKSEDVDLVITNYKKEFIYSGTSVEVNWKDLKEDKVYNFNTFDLDILNTPRRFRRRRLSLLRRVSAAISCKPRCRLPPASIDFATTECFQPKCGISSPCRIKRRLCRLLILIRRLMHRLQPARLAKMLSLYLRLSSIRRSNARTAFPPLLGFSSAVVRSVS